MTHRDGALVLGSTRTALISLVSLSMRRLAMTTDLHLAIAHHLLFLLLAGGLAFEIGVVRSKMHREDILRVARVDIWYGALAGAIILLDFRGQSSRPKAGPTTPSICSFGRNLAPSPWWACYQSCPQWSSFVGERRYRAISPSHQLRTESAMSGAFSSRER